MVARVSVSLTSVIYLYKCFCFPCFYVTLVSSAAIVTALFLRLFEPPSLLLMSMLLMLFTPVVLVILTFSILRGCWLWCCRCFCCCLPLLFLRLLLPIVQINPNRFLHGCQLDRENFSTFAKKRKIPTCHFHSGLNLLRSLHWPDDARDLR